MSEELERNYLIEKILEIEWEMFRNVRPAEPAPCQENRDFFLNIRRSIFETWSEKMLRSYLNDVIEMKRSGRNPFVEKYARMDGLLPPLKDDPLIKKIISEIVKIEERWQMEIKEKYPVLYNTVCRDVSESNSRDFSNYLACELETYGDETVKLYYEHVKDAFKKGQNLAIKSLEILVKKSGFPGLKEAEEALKKQH